MSHDLRTLLYDLVDGIVSNAWFDPDKNIFTVDFTPELMRDMRDRSENRDLTATLWVTGKYIESGWEIQGVFDSEEKAVAACRDEFYFVGPMNLNESAPDETIPWDGAYYPLAKGTQ